MTKCSTCGANLLIDEKFHTCPPLHRVYRCDDDYATPDDAVEMRGNDPEMIAMEYAEKKFGDWEHPLDFEIAVILPDGEEKRFSVEVEAVPSFRVSEIIIADITPDQWEKEVARLKEVKQVSQDLQKRFANVNCQFAIFTIDGLLLRYNRGERTAWLYREMQGIKE